MIAIEEFISEEVEYGDLFYNEGGWPIERTSTSHASMTYSWAASVIVVGAPFAPSDSGRLFTTHPTVESVSSMDEFEEIYLPPDCVVRETRVEAEPVLSSKERLLDVRHFLALTTTELASVMAVSRQAVYSWLQDGADIRTSHLSRLNLLHSLSRECQTALRQPLSRELLKANIGPNSLLSILSKEELDPSSAKEHFAELLVKASSETKKKAGSAAQLSRFNLKPMPEWMQADSIRQAARKMHEG